MKSGSIVGNVNGELIGRVFGHIARDITGRFEGVCNEGTIGGDITGEFNGQLNRCKVRGSIKKGNMVINRSQVLGGVCFKKDEDVSINCSGGKNCGSKSLSVTMSCNRCRTDCGVIHKE